MGALVTIVGNTGVGKTSLMHALRAAYPFNIGEEQHAERPFQALFKTDSRYALSNQFDYLLLRAEQERELRRAAGVGLIDGGLDLDFYGFTHLFYSRGYLQAIEFELCRRLYQTIRASQSLPELVIVLKAREDVIRRRLSLRERINIASAEDLTLLETNLEAWLATLSPQHLIRLEVSTASPDYGEVVPDLVRQIGTRLGLDAGTYDTGYIP